MFDRRPRHSRFGVSLPILAVIFALALTGCSDDVSGDENQGEVTEDDCAPNETWNPISQTCTPSTDPDDQTDAGSPDGDAGGEDPESDTGDDDE